MHMYTTIIHFEIFKGAKQKSHSLVAEDRIDTFDFDFTGKCKSPYSQN